MCSLRNTCCDLWVSLPRRCRLLNKFDSDNPFLTFKRRIMETNSIIPNSDVRPFTVFVEGNIGSGKTTFLNHFTKQDVMVISEPMEMWRNIRGHNVLKLMYADPGRWAFTFQSLVQKTMLDLHLKSTNHTVKLLERSIYSARYCFVENLYKEGLMSAPEYAVLDEWFKWITNNLKISGDLMVYLRTDPEVVHKRIMARGRNEESGLTLTYLQHLHRLHEDWLINKTIFSCPVPVVVLDANKNMSEVLKEFKLIEPEIVDKISLRQKDKIGTACSPTKVRELVVSVPEQNVLNTAH